MTGVDQAAAQDIFSGDVLVMTFIGFCGRSDDGLRKFIGFTHAIGHGNSAEHSFAGLILTPGVAGKVSPDDHFHSLRNAFFTDHHIGIRAGLHPVGYNIAGGFKEKSCHLIQHLSFVGNGPGQDVIKCGDPVRCNHDHPLSDGVYITYFAVINFLLRMKIKIGGLDTVHVQYFLSSEINELILVVSINRTPGHP